MEIEKFKKELENICNIYSWNPSNIQLFAICKDVAELSASGREASKSDLENIILSHIKDVRFLALEGVDNTDLKMLLLLATKVSESGKK
jgi:hypothetical protein